MNPDDANATATPGTLDGDLAENPGADDPTVIESVFADAGNDGVEQAEDSYEIVSAALTITKTSAVISDPFSSGKAVPDAVIEYTITIDNSGGGSAAQSVVVTDNIQVADVTFEPPGRRPAGRRRRRPGCGDRCRVLQRRRG